MALSTYSTISLEDVIEQKGTAVNPYAFQLSILKNRDTSLSWIKRAEGWFLFSMFQNSSGPKSLYCNSRY